MTRCSRLGSASATGKAGGLLLAMFAALAGAPGHAWAQG